MATDERRRQAEEPRERSARRLTAVGAAHAAERHIAELTGKPTEGVVSMEPAETGPGWLVGVEVLENRRIPESSDVLATYQVEISSDGKLEAYRRIRRYARGGDGSGT
jgi:hypothetical protein